MRFAATARARAPNSTERRGPAAALRIEATLSAALEPFRGYLLFETYVDGRRWAPKSDTCRWFPNGRNRLSRAERPGVDVVYSGCPRGARPGAPVPAFGGRRGPGVGPGTHQVQVIASSPDGRFRLASTSASITLGCDPPSTPADDVTTTSGGDAPPEVAPPPHSPSARGRCSVDDLGWSDPAWALAVVLLVRARRRARLPTRPRLPAPPEQRRRDNRPIHASAPSHARAASTSQSRARALPSVPDPYHSRTNSRVLGRPPACYAR